MQVFNMEELMSDPDIMEGMNDPKVCPGRQLPAHAALGAPTAPSWASPASALLMLTLKKAAPLQAMKAMFDIKQDPQAIENYRDRPALYKALRKLFRDI